MENQAVINVKKHFKGDRVLKVDASELKKEMYYIECNPDISEYLCALKDQLTDPVPNVNNSAIMYVMGLSDEMPKSGGISKTPTTLPDIDYDTDGRDAVKEYLVKKYGSDHVTLLGTYQTLKTKGAIKDSIRQLRPNMEFEEVNNLTKKFDAIKRTDSEAIEESIRNATSGRDYSFLGDNFSSEIAFFYACVELDPTVRKWFEENKEVEEAVTQLLGNAKATGIHAGGIVVSAANVPETIPVTFSQDAGLWVTQPEMAFVEESGLVKFDFLGLATLADLNLCLRLIKARHNKTIHFKDIPLDDQRVLDQFRKGNTQSVFQFNTSLSVSILTKLKSVSSINDLAIITSIARPGPLTMQMDKTFIARNNGDEEIRYLHPLLEPILKDTYGITCIAEGSNILTKRGLVPIELVKKGDFVKTEDGSWQKVLKNLDQGNKETIRVRTSNGQELVCTPDHKILTQSGWKYAADLLTSDIIKSFWENDISSKIGDDRDWLIGLALADGSLNESSITIACSDENFAKKVCKIAKRSFGLGNAHTMKNGDSWYAVMSMVKGHNGYFSKKFKKNPFKEKIVQLGLFNKDSYSKFMPPNPSLSLIAGFIEGDGSLISNKVRVKNKNLAFGLYMSLQGNKIPSNFYEEETGVWAVSFNDYEGKIPFRIKKYKKSNSPKIYLPKQYIQHLDIPKRRDNSLLYQQLKKKTDIVHWKFFKDYDITPDHDHWSRVLSVKSDKIRHVYDLSVENVHSFVVGGLVAHNCYQEQVMQSVQVLGGLSGDESVTVLKAMGKKQKDKLVKFKDKFLRVAQEKNKIPGALADEIWQYLEAFAEYGFNRSHAIAYSCVSYLCMWFKEYYSAEWKAAVLTNSDKDDFKVLYQFWKDDIRPPNINLSKNQYIIDDQNRVIMPLGSVNGNGTAVVEAIVKGQPYTSFEDFFSRVDKRKVTKAAMTNLIFAGCFDVLKPNQHYSEFKFRKETVAQLLKLREKIKKPSAVERKEQEEFLKELTDMSRGQMMMKEISLLNFTSFDYHEYYHAQMTEGAKKAFGHEALRPHEVLNMSNNKVVVVGGAVQSINFFPLKSGPNKGKEMCKIELSNDGGTCTVMVFAKTLELSDKAGGKIRKIKEYTPLIVKGKVNHWNGTVSVVYDEGWILI